MKLLIKGGRVLDPSIPFDEEADVFLENGRVAAIGRALGRGGLAEDVLVIEAAGCLVTPGLIDMHVHLREPGREYAETIESGTRAAARGGFTAVACMPNTEPALDTHAAVRFVVERAREVGAVRVFPVGAVSHGRAGEALTEVGDLVRAGAVALSDDGSPVASALLMRRALEYTRIFGIPVVSHAEDPVLSAGGMVHEGPVSTVAGLRGIPAASEEVAVARDIALAELTGGKLHIAHLSTGAAVGLLRRARERGLAVSGEVTPHHLTLTDEAVRGYDPNTKMNPPLRSASDRQALREGLAEGTIGAIGSDHAPHAADEKDVEFGLAPFGIVGLETAVGVVFTHLVHLGIVSLERAIAAWTCGPARVLGLPLGTLAKGAPGDVTVISPEERWTVDPTRFASRSANTPFAGWELRGAPIGTVVEGRVVMYRGELFPDPRKLVASPSASL